MEHEPVVILTRGDQGVVTGHARWSKSCTEKDSENCSAIIRGSLRNLLEEGVPPIQCGEKGFAAFRVNPTPFFLGLSSNSCEIMNATLS